MSLKKKKKNSYNKRRENYHRISDAHRETLLSSASKGIYLFRCRNRRRRAVSDLPRVQFHVILWISDRTAPHSLHHACQYTGLHLHHTPIGSEPGSPYLLLRSGMPVITTLSSSTQISSIPIFISPRPRPGSSLAPTSQEDTADICAF